MLSIRDWESESDDLWEKWTRMSENMRFTCRDSFQNSNRISYFVPMSKNYAIPFLLLVGALLMLSSCTKELERDNRRLQVRIDTLEQTIQSLTAENNQLRLSLGERPEVGFEVQIGAFESFNVQAYESELLRLREVSEDGVSKYVLGTFIRFEDASSFLRDVKKMGISDAFIAGIVGGQRATVAEAREAAKIAYGY